MSASCVAYHEEGSEDRESMASSALPLFLILHSLLQWRAAAGQHKPLTVLTRAVRAMVMISDIFTQDAQFSWMLESLSDRCRVHPVEDELLTELLIFGISKAVSVVGFTELERLKKGLEVAQRGVWQVSSAGCGACEGQPPVGVGQVPGYGRAAVPHLLGPDALQP